MATSPSKVDDLSKGDRMMVVSALTIMLASQRRAERSAPTAVVREAWSAEIVKTEQLLSRFREPQS